MPVAVRIENLSKKYQLGVIGHGYLFRDLQRWWSKQEGKKDPNAPIFEEKGDESKEQWIWALKNISLEINKGDRVGVIGKNGAGKSTLLKILSRIMLPSEGCVKMNGHVASLLEIGTGFHPELTGEDNIYLNGAFLGFKQKDMHQDVGRIIEFAGLERFMDTPVKRYSSGMYVRLAFSIAAHLRTDILLVDEVLALGDFEFQKKCIERMLRISEEGRTIVFVSHNLNFVENLSTHCVLLENGSIKAQGQATEVIASYPS